MASNAMEKKSKSYVWLLIGVVLLAAMWLSGCGTQQAMPQSVPVRSVQIPALASYAKQPVTPSECLPTCYEGLTRERIFWQESLTTGTLQAVPANASTVTPTKN
jgi:hypothetical protein